VTQIEDVEGIGPAYGKKLSDAGVKTTEKLLERGANPKGRHDLAEATGITEPMILAWVNRCDLGRVHGIGSEYADLLEAAGVDSPPELAQRAPANLVATLERVNTQKKLVRRLPTETEVQRWISEARTLPRMVEH
jgi:predicted flap endonuclease-1-like 5' DNA nuclease